MASALAAQASDRRDPNPARRTDRPGAGNLLTWRAAAVMELGAVRRAAPVRGERARCCWLATHVKPYARSLLRGACGNGESTTGAIGTQQVGTDASQATLDGNRFNAHAAHVVLLSGQDC